MREDCDCSFLPLFSFLWLFSRNSRSWTRRDRTVRPLLSSKPSEHQMQTVSWWNPVHSIHERGIQSLDTRLSRVGRSIRWDFRISDMSDTSNSLIYWKRNIINPWSRVSRGWSRMIFPSWSKPSSEMGKPTPSRSISHVRMSSGNRRSGMISRNLVRYSRK